jgi:hypothetical protein
MVRQLRKQNTTLGEQLPAPGYNQLNEFGADPDRRDRQREVMKFIPDHFTRVLERIGIGLAILVLLAILAIRNTPSDEDYCYKLTLSRLAALNFLLEKLHVKETPLVFSLSDLLQFGKLHGLVTLPVNGEKSSDAVDGWGNDFVFTKSDDGHRVVITISSAGRNQIYENGNGDDIRIQRVFRR